MSDRDRLKDLEDILKLHYAKLGKLQKRLIASNSESEKFDLEQQIKREILPSILNYETEYWALCPQEEIIISDEEATTQLVKIEQTVTSIEQIPSSTYPSELFSLLQEIRDKLNEPEKAASAKLKVALPLIPAIASYELEMDTEGLMYKTWNAIKIHLKKK